MRYYIGAMATNQNIQSLSNAQLLSGLLAHFQTSDGRREAAAILGHALAADVFLLGKRMSVSGYEVSADDKLIIAQVMRRIH